MLLSVTSTLYFVECASVAATVGGEGGEALSGVAADVESKESGVALRDLVPVLDAYRYVRKK